MTSTTNTTAAHAELEKNMAAYKEMESKLVPKHKGKGALLSDGKLIDIYEDTTAAYKAGVREYGMGKFSIKEIGAEPVDLGIVGYLIAASQQAKQARLN